MKYLLFFEQLKVTQIFLKKYLNFSLKSLFSSRDDHQLEKFSSREFFLQLEDRLESDSEIFSHNFRGKRKEMYQLKVNCILSGIFKRSFKRKENQKLFG